MKNIPQKKDSSISPLFLIFLIVFAMLSIAGILAILDPTSDPHLKLSEKIYYSIFLGIFLFIFPLFFYVSVRLKTKFIGKIDPDEISIDELEKIYNIKQRSQDYSERLPYFFSKEFNVKIFLSHFLIPWIWISLFVFFQHLLERNFSSDFFISSLLFIICLFLFLGLNYNSMKSIYLEINIKKFLCNFFWYITFNCVYMTAIFLASAFFIRLLVKGEILYINQFLMSNPSLATNYISIAQISFLLFTGSLIVLGIAKTYFKTREKLEEIFEVYGGYIKKKYKNSGKKDFSSFLLEYFGEKEKSPNKRKRRDKEKINEKKIATLQNVISLFRIMTKYSKIYAYIGFLFLMLPFGELEVSEQGSLTIDIILLLGLGMAAIFQSIEIGWVFEK